MSVTPSGTLSTALSLLRTLLSNSATFKTLVGAASAALAVRHIRYFGVDPPIVWTTGTAYGLGATALPTATGPWGFLMECTTAGSSGATEPTWPTTAGGTVVDGTVTWTARAVVANPDNTAVRRARPFAAVGVGEAVMVAKEAVHETGLSGELFILLAADAPAAYADGFGEAGLWWANQVGGIMKDIQDLGGTAGYLNVTQVTLENFGRVVGERETGEGDWFGAMLLISIEGLA